jgi:histidinol-phosphatase (PHP family)
MEPEEAMAAASKLGLGLCLSEHVDYECDTDDVCVADIGGYFREYAAHRPSGLLLGLEIGLTVNTRAIARKTASDPRLDFCIGSVHLSFGHDIFYPSFWSQGISLEEVVGNYLKYNAIVTDKCDFFDSLGHIDYPSRYCPLPDKSIKYGAYKRLYDEVFTALLDRGKVIEINTRRFGEPNAQQNLYEIYEGYHKLGGRYVTLGSDAHYAARVGSGVDAAARMAVKIGLKPVHFVQREMIVDA